jgi:hypothetical protein
MNLQVESVEELYSLLEGVILGHNLELAFHPDTDFSEYVNKNTAQPTFTSEEAALYNQLLDSAVYFCEQRKLDIYAISMNIIIKHYERLHDITGNKYWNTRAVA